MMDGLCTNSNQKPPDRPDPEFCIGSTMRSDKPRADGLNLTTHRAAGNVWNRAGWNGAPEQLAWSRWLVGIGGIALAAHGLRQRTRAGGLFVGLGGGLAWW